MIERRPPVPEHGPELPGETLPEIPYFDLGISAPPTLVDRAPDRVRAILSHSRRHYGSMLLRLGDAGIRRWLARNGNPYRHEIAEVAGKVHHPGAFLLNCSYEWSCTTGVGPAPDGAGSRMLRTLDWPVHGIGSNVVVARREAPAGEFFDVTWPGLIGILTAMAPGRFSAAINQPPLPRRTGSCWFDWAITRRGVWRHSGLPPTHLLRRVFDTCETYAEAKTMLCETPICVPVFFSLSGIRPDEGCVIERREHDFRLHEAPAAMSNHWRAFSVAGHDRGTDSVGRLDLMERLRDGSADGLDWVTEPILNWQTRLAVVADAARKVLIVQGYEADRVATQPFTLAARRSAGTGRTTPAPEAAA